VVHRLVVPKKDDRQVKNCSNGLGQQVNGILVSDNAFVTYL
jgi:hypothetical protein